MLLPPEEEYPGQFKNQDYERSKAIQMSRIFNFIKYFDFTNTTLKISRVGLKHLIIHPLGEHGETLDINFDEDWHAIYYEKVFTKKGRKWLEKNWVLPEVSRSLTDDLEATTIDIP